MKVSELIRQLETMPDVEVELSYDPMDESGGVEIGSVILQEFDDGTIYDVVIIVPLRGYWE